jgi:hypothetical protein
MPSTINHTNMQQSIERIIKAAKVVALRPVITPALDYRPPTRSPILPMPLHQLPFWCG